MISLISDNKKEKFISAAPETSSLYLESDLAPNDDYLYVPEGEHARFMSPQKMNQKLEATRYDGKFEFHAIYFVSSNLLLSSYRFLHSKSTFQHESILSSTSIY